MTTRNTIPAIVAAVFFHGGCDVCGPPAEPLIDVRVDLDVMVQPAPDDYLHLQMLNQTGAVVTSYDRSVSSIGQFPFEHLLGNCDGYMQQSGTFTVRAWLDLRSYDAVEPAAGAPQGVDRIEVTCNRDDGCVAARDAAITIVP